MSDKKMSEYLWRDCKSDQERADFILCGRACETGVIAPSIQSEVAMAFQRLATLAAQPPCGADGAVPEEICPACLPIVGRRLAMRCAATRRLPLPKQTTTMPIACAQCGAEHLNDTKEAWAILQLGQCIECQKKDNDHHPTAPVAPATVAVPDEVDLWCFLRDVLKRGASIESQFSQQGYETFISEIEAAARKEDGRLRAMLAAATTAASHSHDEAIAAAHADGKIKFTPPGPITGVWIDEATEPSKEGE